MPDEHGRIRPISVPRVPWHEAKELADMAGEMRERIRPMRDELATALERLAEQEKANAQALRKSIR